MGVKAYTVSGGKAKFLVSLFGLDGSLVALIDADVLGAYRTGAATAVAARALAPKGPLVVAVFGSGYQARTKCWRSRGC